MDYAKISKETISHLYTAYSSLKNSPLSPDLGALIELRVSQINNCNYCCNLHKNEAIKLGIDSRKIELLPQFATSSLFTNAEQETLSWAESLTLLNEPKKVKHTKLHLYFNELEIVDITACIAMMNMFNRLAISMHDE